jgi:hypothetical protein
VPDRYVTRFERRSIADIAALCGDREGERPFEVVRRVSEINAGLYEQLAAPVVQQLANEGTAELLRQFHPLRFQRWALSDLNPFLWPVTAAASYVRANRNACAADNPFRVFERTVAQTVERGLDTVADARDKAAETAFNALYAHPVARAITGLASAPAPAPLGADPARRELARREARELVANAAGGTFRDGIVRILLLLLNEQGAVDERTYRALQAVRQELPAHHRVSPAVIRELARREALLLRADREAAIRGLETIFADPSDRDLARTILNKVADAVGARIEVTDSGPVATVLGADKQQSRTARAS